MVGTCETTGTKTHSDSYYDILGIRLLLESDEEQVSVWVRRLSLFERFNAVGSLTSACFLTDPAIRRHGFGIFQVILRVTKRRS